MVFGNNPALPNVFNNELPALNPTPPYETIRQNLNAMHSAREGFVKFESNERISRALRHNIRSTEASLIKAGDQVFYKRNEQQEWHGPAVVLGRDGKLFILRHAGVVVKVHECRLREASAPKKSKSEFPLKQSEPLEICTKESDNLQEDVIDADENSSCSSESEDEYYNAESGVRSEITPERISISQEEREPMSQNRQNARPMVHIGQRISAKTNEGDMLVGKVHSRAGKASGKYQNCYNIEMTDGKIQCIDICKDLSDLKLVSDSTELLVMYAAKDLVASKEEEIQNWTKNDVFTEVEDTGQTAMSVRWVNTEKIKDGKPKVKSRLVARGFEENSTGLLTHSPTCSKEAGWLTLAIDAANEWCCNTIDVKAAYLQGKPIVREVYLRPPPEYANGKLWKLNKTVYGLSDAALQWYLRVKEELLRLGMSISKLEPALFAWKISGRTKGILCLYVDDILWAGENTFKEEVVDKIYSMFQIGSSASKSFRYIGLNIENSLDGSTSVDQHDYSVSIEPINLSKARLNNRNSELNEKEKSEYRGLLGQLNWVAMQTRPDIAFDVGEHSMRIKNATVSDVCSLNKVLKCLNNNHYAIHYPPMSNLRSCVIEAYSDASFANLNDGSSQGGILIFLSDQQGARCPIYWESRKIRRVVKSTLAAETLALSDAAETAIYIKHIINEMVNDVTLPIVCYTDNKSLVDVLDSKKNVDDKRLRIDLALLKEMLQSKEVASIQWVSTSGQLANCLTKRGASPAQLLAAISRT